MGEHFAYPYAARSTAGTRALASCPCGLSPNRRDPAAAGLVSAEELSMVAMFADGLSVEVIARRMEVSARTVRRRMRVLCDRLDVRFAVQAVTWAVRHGLI